MLIVIISKIATHGPNAFFSLNFLDNRKEIEDKRLKPKRNDQILVLYKMNRDQLMW